MVPTAIVLLFVLLGVVVLFIAHQNDQIAQVNGRVSRRNEEIIHLEEKLKQNVGIWTGTADTLCQDLKGLKDTLAKVQELRKRDNEAINDNFKRADNRLGELGTAIATLTKRISVAEINVRHLDERTFAASRILAGESRPTRIETKPEPTVADKATASALSERLLRQLEKLPKPGELSKPGEILNQPAARPGLCLLPAKKAPTEGDRASFSADARKALMLEQMNASQAARGRGIIEQAQAANAAGGTDAGAPAK